MASDQEGPASSKTADVAVASTVPTVILDTNIVSHNMAARLCMSFLGHVLYLKNQVPFPIVQLARMPMNDETSRAFKKRQELLNSFDTLASHLYTTFIALSTALALRGSPENVGAEAETRSGNHQKCDVARIFFAAALGPTVGSAKSRVIVGIDGLETKVWGLREDNTVGNTLSTRGVPADEGASDTDEDGDEQNNDGETAGSSEEEDECASESSDGDSPPLSRSPSPTLSIDSDIPSSRLSSSIPSELPPSRGENLETIRAAERLLSRTLANAYAEDDGRGLTAEMAPTQTHILLRAPRRFNHPSWTPRQNLNASFDSYLADFLVQSGEAVPFSDVSTKKRTKTDKVHGLWVKSQGINTQMEDDEDELAEEDELIWWSWEGKLVGFASW